MSTAIKINNYLNGFFKMNLEDSDKELFNSIKDEFTRQKIILSLLLQKI